MASVQPTQGMPQQGQAQGKPMQGNSILPPGMSKEQVQGLYQVCATSFAFSSLAQLAD